MNNKTILIGAIIVAIIGIGGYTVLAPMQMGTMDHSAMAPADGPATPGYQAAMDGMMKGMAAAPTGKPDLDFIQGMIPHHQGAIDMAKVVLQHGKDAEVKTFAENVVKAQEGEIAFMNAWLAKTDKNALVSVPEVNARKCRSHGHHDEGHDGALLRAMPMWISSRA